MSREDVKELFKMAFIVFYSPYFPIVQIAVAMTIMALLNTKFSDNTVNGIILLLVYVLSIKPWLKLKKKWRIEEWF